MPAACWPSYPCTEHKGQGWTAHIIALHRANAAKVRFTEAADDRGLPFSDVQVLEELAKLLYATAAYSASWSSLWWASWSIGLCARCRESTKGGANASLWSRIRCAWRK